MRTLLECLEGLGCPRIAVVGDFMLDRWVYGNAERLSPEAPVPVLRKVPQDKVLAGGAGNTAEAIAALGAKPVCLGVVGDDPAGGQVSKLLAEGGADSSRLIRLVRRPTTVKTRYVGLAQHRHAQQMFRVDAEVTDPLDDQAGDMLAAAVRGEIRTCDALALEMPTRWADAISVNSHQDLESIQSPCGR